MNYYTTLGLQKNATVQEIKKSYRKLAMKYHPDRNAGDKKAEEQFKKIGEAYATLSDPGKREMYDLSYNDNYENRSHFNQNNNNTHNNFNNRKSAFNSDDEINEFMRSAFGNKNPFNDFFEDQFAQQSTQQRTQQRTRQVHNINLSFWEAIFGVTKQFEYIDRLGKRKIIDVTIPAAVEDNTTLELDIKDEYDLYLHISVEQDNYFTRDNLDLYTTIELPMTTAILGGIITFPHWANQLEVDIPPGTQNGQTLRLANAGIRKNIFIGDLYLKCNIIMPKKITKEQKELLEKYAQLEKDNQKSSLFDYLNETWKKFFKK